MSSHRVTDVMLYVADLAAAARALQALGLVEREGGDGWRLFEDERSGQRIVMSERAFGAGAALAVAAPDLEAFVRLSTHLGWTSAARTPGATHVTLTHPSGLSIVGYAAPPED